MCVLSVMLPFFRNPQPLEIFLKKNEECKGAPLNWSENGDLIID